MAAADASAASTYPTKWWAKQIGVEFNSIRTQKDRRWSEAADKQPCDPSVKALVHSLPFWANMNKRIYHGPHSARGMPVCEISKGRDGTAYRSLAPGGAQQGPEI